MAASPAPTFDRLVSSRKKWIDEVLKPWCRSASRTELKRAELEWENLAGRVDADDTLWTWAWSRFPDLVHEEMAGVNESRPVLVTLHDGRELVGYPDGRGSRDGRLLLLQIDNDGTVIESGPHSIDEIGEVRAVEV